MLWVNGIEAAITQAEAQNSKDPVGHGIFDNKMSDEAPCGGMQLVGEGAGPCKW